MKHTQYYTLASRKLDLWQLLLFYNIHVMNPVSLKKSREVENFHWQKFNVQLAKIHMKTPYFWCQNCYKQAYSYQNNRATVMYTKILLSIWCCFKFFITQLGSKIFIWCDDCVVVMGDKCRLYMLLVILGFFAESYFCWEILFEIRIHEIKVNSLDFKLLNLEITCML